jgi:hypothetical protein
MVAITIKENKMKKLSIVFIFLLVVLWSTASYAKVIVFAWDPNDELDLLGYRLYQSDTSGQYTFGSGNEVVEIPTGTETVSIDVPDGTYFWVLTAFDTSANESGPSDEVSETIDTTPPGVPQNFKKQ